MSNLKLQMFRFFFLFPSYFETLFFSPVHLWVSVLLHKCLEWLGNRFRYRTLTASPRWKGSQAAGRPLNWLSSSQRHLSSKAARGKMLKEKKKKIIICFPHAVACMQFQIPDVEVMFYLLWMRMEGERGVDVERRFGSLLLDCDCCTGQEALCGCSTGKDERLEQSLSELRSVVRRKCCVWGRQGLSCDQPISWGFVQLCYNTGISAQLCENICCLTYDTSR